MKRIFAARKFYVVAGHFCQFVQVAICRVPFPQVQQQRVNVYAVFGDATDNAVGAGKGDAFGIDGGLRR